jgi:hypothetical protein
MEQVFQKSRTYERLNRSRNLEHILYTIWVGWAGSLRESTKHQPHEVPSASPRNSAYSRRRV